MRAEAEAAPPTANPEASLAPDALLPVGDSMKPTDAPDAGGARESDIAAARGGVSRKGENRCG